MIQERDKYLKDRRKITSLILHGMTFAFFLTNVDVLLAQFKFQIEAKLEWRFWSRGRTSCNNLLHSNSGSHSVSRGN